MGIASHCYSHSLNNRSDKSLTVGTDGSFEAMPILESLGFRWYWDTYGVKLSFEKVVKIITSTEQFNSFVKTLNEVDLNKLLLYDQCVFGTKRNYLMQRWINTSGSFGWAAIDKNTNDITCYTVLKQVIRGGGTEIGMAMAPLYADNASLNEWTECELSQSYTDSLKDEPLTSVSELHSQAGSTDSESHCSIGEIFN